VYDGRMEPHEFMGADRNEAVAKACSFFGAQESDLVIHELDPTEVYGIGARTVVVAVPANLPQRPSRSARGEREERPERGRGRERGRERGPRGRGGPARAVEAPVDEEPVGESVGTARTTLGEVGEYVKGILERMDLGPFEVGESEDEGDLAVVQLTGAAASRLRSGESRAAEGIQLLANQLSMRLGLERRVVVDVEGESMEREAFLERIAERAATRARDSGRAVALEPMNGRDRRVIHVALRDAPDIATMSIGEGRYRQVVVVPKGAPEYEEARRYESEATRVED
jgi:spoIIIJ-associated protein